LEVLPTLPQVDAVVTDPPYGEKTHAGQRSLKRYEDPPGGHVAIDFDCITADELRKVFGLCRARRWLVSFIEWRHCLPLEIHPPPGLEFIRMGVWTKINPMPQLTGDRPGTGWEAIAIFHPAGAKRWNGGGKSAVWMHETSRCNWFGASNHPTEKPVGLVMDMIGKFTDQSETILDPFTGSGTTGVACVKTGRKFIGIEIEERYCEIAARRLDAEISKGNLFAEAKEEQPEQQQMFD